MSSSWNDETSHTTRPPETHPSSSQRARPTLPATGASRITPSSSLVVVLPFVPVTATSSAPGNRRKPSSTSLQTGTPSRRARPPGGPPPGTPGLLTTTSTASTSSSSSVPSQTSTPASASLP